jgi:pilus assembly protein CpaB
MHRRLTGFIAAAVCALVGTLILVGYVHSAEARALSGDETVDVLVVSKAIEAGTAADDLAGRVELAHVPAKVRADGAVLDLDDVKGLVTTVDLLPGEQLLRERFSETSRAGVPDGLLEVTVALDPERANAGRIAAGDHVGVSASFDHETDSDADTTRMILHEVLVTSVLRDGAATTTAKDGDDEAVAPTGRLLVTLAIDAASVDKVVFAAEHGRIWLSSMPTDAPNTETPVLTRVEELA